MNTEIIIHPKLQHYGLITANLDTMIDWYRKVLGMTINHRSLVPARAQNRAPFSAMAFVSNDEVNHRIVFFEVHRAVEFGQTPGAATACRFRVRNIRRSAWHLRSAQGPGNPAGLGG